MRRGKEKLHRPEYMEQMNAETPAEMAHTLMQGVIDSENPAQARSPRRPLLHSSMTVVEIFWRISTRHVSLAD